MKIGEIIGSSLKFHSVIRRNYIVELEFLIIVHVEF